MKRMLQNLFTTCLLLIGSMTCLVAQPCTVDPQYTAPGIYPSDTLEDMAVGCATNQVVQFVFPDDTVLFGFTLPFDSFKVSNVDSLPPGIGWECNANHPTCLYVTTPGQLTRGCVLMYGTPTAASPSFPSYDSIIVTGTAYVTVPFVGVTPVAQDISVYYRIDQVCTGVGNPESRLEMRIVPVPVTGRCKVSFHLINAANVRVSVMDVLGREVALLANEPMRAGEHALDFDGGQIAPGTYLLKLDMNGGEFFETVRFMSNKR